MGFSTIFMMIFILAFVWGGFIFFIILAILKEKKKQIKNSNI